MTISDPNSLQQLIDWGAKQLVDSDSPVLDARLLLGKVLDKDQTWLRTWPEKSVSEAQQNHFQHLIRQRQQGQPVAYLLGYRDFWTLRLKVSQHTLIPRPETEVMVQAALDLPLPQQAKVLDLGTGTGAIALALASERPDWQVKGLDRVVEAVELARCNAKAHQLQRVEFLHSHWFDALTRNSEKFDLIVSNPPYVELDSHWLQQGDVRFEPKSALISGEQGLDDIQHIVEQAPSHLAAGGWLALEHGYQQGEMVSALLADADFQQVNTLTDLNQLPRVTLACKQV